MSELASNPESHEHSYPPAKFIQSPLLHISGDSHSSMSETKTREGPFS